MCLLYKVKTIYFYRISTKIISTKSHLFSLYNDLKPSPKRYIILTILILTPSIENVIENPHNFTKSSSLYYIPANTLNIVPRLYNKGQIKFSSLLFSRFPLFANPPDVSKPSKIQVTIEFTVPPRTRFSFFFFVPFLRTSFYSRRFLFIGDSESYI